MEEEKGNRTASKIMKKTVVLLCGIMDYFICSTVGAAFVLLSVANATVVFSPIPQQTWRKPAGFRRSQQHLARLQARGGGGAREVWFL